MADQTERIYSMTYESIYPMYVAKVERKGRTKAELDQVLTWLIGVPEPEKLTGTYEELEKRLTVNPKASEIKGVVCGVRVEELTDPVVRLVRLMDKVVDELAKGREMEKILREG